MTLQNQYLTWENSQYNGFPAKWPLRNKCRNSILMMWLLRSGKSFWLVDASFLPGTTNQKHYAYLGGDTSSVWNFCTCSSDIILWGNQWQRHKMLAVFSGMSTLIIREILEILLWRSLKCILLWFPTPAIWEDLCCSKSLITDYVYSVPTWLLLTWSLGWTGFLDPISPPISSMARLLITSLTFMLDWVPEPVCHTTSGKLSFNFPDITWK